MNVFELDDYKIILRSAMTERRRQFGFRFTFEKMAEACGIQKTYLSKVLNGSTHLNADQLFAACDYLQLKPPETEFVLLLRESQIVLNAKRAGLLSIKIKNARKEYLKSESVIEFDKVTTIETHKWEYYTDVDLQLVHMFMTVPEFAKEPIKICDQIGINEERLQAILLKLQLWQLIDFQKGIYKAKDPKLHLSENEPVFIAFGILHRIKTLEKLRRAKPEKSDDYFFSALFSANSALQVRLKKKILDLLKEAQREAANSKLEQVYQLNIDLFRWS